MNWGGVILHILLSGFLPFLGHLAIWSLEGGMVEEWPSHVEFYCKELPFQKS